LLLGTVKQLTIDSNLLEFFLGFLISLSVLPHHHFLYLFSLLYCLLEVPLLRLELFVLLLDAFDLPTNLLNLLLEQGYSLLTFFPYFLDLLLKRFDLVFVDFGVLFGKCYLHLLFHL
jgi:hypothetical protein